jgi:hypothetical protein
MHYRHDQWQPDVTANFSSVLFRTGGEKAGIRRLTSRPRSWAR